MELFSPWTLRFFQRCRWAAGRLVSASGLFLLFGSIGLRVLYAQWGHFYTRNILVLRPSAEVVPVWSPDCLPTARLLYFTGPTPDLWPLFFGSLLLGYLALWFLLSQNPFARWRPWFRIAVLGYAMLFHLAAADSLPRIGDVEFEVDYPRGVSYASLPPDTFRGPTCFEVFRFFPWLPFGLPAKWFFAISAPALLVAAFVGLLSLGRLVLRDGEVGGGLEGQGAPGQGRSKKGMWGMFLAWVFLVPVVVGGSWAYARAMRVLGKVVLRTVQLCPVLETDAGCSAGFVVFAVLVFLGGWLGVWMWVGGPSVGALGSFLLACWGMMVGLFGFFGWPWLDLGLSGFFLGEYPWPLAKNQPLWLALAGLCWLGASWVLARSARRAESR